MVEYRKAIRRNATILEKSCRSLIFYLPAGNAFCSMVKPKQTVVVINLSAAGGCPVAERRGRPEKYKADDEKRDSHVRPGNAIRTIAHMAASKSINLRQESHSFKQHHSGK